ncbi:unnamed protein product [Cyprideis torosa]|uniref:Uncharacterized protein n=1 Tax=Cyprideis torosa TaxID=163714 RepID=A0A7R8WBR7_9CRUS|nr:unnamed protein product [Cyprideis torosa]CAG0892544.1 unnamed protein product [Cyprideis torosa]
MSRRKSARVRHLESGASDHGMYQWFPPTAVNDTVEGRVLEEEDLTPPPAKRQRPISSKKKAPPENLTGNAFLDIKLTGCTSRIEIKTDRHPPGSCPVVAVGGTEKLFSDNDPGDKPSRAKKKAFKSDGSIPLLKDSDGGTLPAPAEVDGFSFWLYFSEEEDGSLLYWEKTTSDLKKRNSENTNKDFGFWSLKGFPFFADNDFFRGSIPLLKDSDGGTLPAPAEVDGFSFWLYFSEQEDGSLLYWEKTTSDLKKRNSENTNKDFGFWSLKGFPFFADNDFFKAPERQHFPKIPVEEVFENLYQSQESYYSELDERVQHPSLNVSLRPYQDDAHEQELTINRFTGEAILGPAPPLPSLPLGGVLADEMGLGKTVEVLALILCNPSSSHGPDLSSEQKVSYLKPVPSDSPVFVQPIKPVDKAIAKAPKGKNQLYQRLYSGTYLTALSEWDMTARLRKDEEKKKKNQEFFNTKCICGKGGSEGVSCEICGLFQHPDCLGYDLSDPARGPFYCPHCWLDQPVVPSRATLIVSPSSICDQWADEIRRHISVQGLKIFVYR